MCRTGLANLAIFYFHFGDTTKQDARNLLCSVLFQLCSQSEKFSEVLSSIFSSHGNGSREPSIFTLRECLKQILTRQGQAPLYIVVDALDESPNSSGLRTKRQEVLEILKELIELKLSHVHFCITSRPEIDIRRVFDPLIPQIVSLHNQAGQIIDLAEYVKSVVGSDPTMQNWPAKVKELVVDTLAKRGGGMYVIVVLTPIIPFSCDNIRFRWAYCQLETLRQCPLRYIRSTLDELPETLDETYERILQGIPKKMWNDAHRILQWLTVSSRPLRVEELAEVFAIDFDEEMSGIPRLNPSWRDANAETAVLSACSTLVSIVNTWFGRKIVQFSHFSVKEYLTSDRIANADHVSCFYIHPKPAHSLLAEACLSVLCHLDYSIDEANIIHSPLAKYAAEHWLEHVRVDDVSSYIDDGMDLLFDKEKPHFTAWIRAHNIDKGGSRYRHRHTARPGQLDPIPLYYAALCGFSGLVGRLLTAHPGDLNTEGGIWGSPLNAASAKGHLNIALFLLDCGADSENRNKQDHTALYIASSRGHTDVVRSLIDRGADLNVKCQDRRNDHIIESQVTWTPLHVAISKEHQDIAILLVEGGADTEIRSIPDELGEYRKARRRRRLDLDQTALYLASSYGCVDVVRSLIYHGAVLNAKCQDRGDVTWTPLHVAIQKDHLDIVVLLLEGGADTETRTSFDETALYMASSLGRADIVRELISHGADLNTGCRTSDMAGDDVKWTPLHVASSKGNAPVTRILLEHGANPNAPDTKGATAFQVALELCPDITVVELLLEYGANVDVRNKEGWTQLHRIAYYGNLQLLEVLLNHGADPHAQTDDGKTPIQLANEFIWSDFEAEKEQIIGLLSERTGERM